MGLKARYFKVIIRSISIMECGQLAYGGKDFKLLGTKIAKNCIYSFFCNTVQIHMVNQRWNAIDRKRNASACSQL